MFRVKENSMGKKKGETMELEPLGQHRTQLILGQGVPKEKVLKRKRRKGILLSRKKEGKYW